MSGVDAVITWVNGDDPAHKAKRMKYGSASVHSSIDKAADTRFADIGEIFWCVASLNRFAPWLRRIYIVTDEQDPCLGDFLERNFPQGHIPVEIVDHKVIFRGYEEYLPTFNSISLETLTWRIPGLSDRFIEFNDDLMLLSPVSEDDFFTADGKVVCYGQRASVLWDSLTRKFKPGRGAQKKVTTKGSHMNGALQAGHRLSYFRLAHCQKALRRDFYEEWFSQHPEAMIRNIRYRFRDAEQFTSQVLQYMSLYDAGRCELRSASEELFFFQPKRKDGYFRKKMERLRRFKGRFACFNSVDMASEDERAELVAWVEEKLDIRLR